MNLRRRNRARLPVARNGRRHGPVILNVVLAGVKPACPLLLLTPSLTMLLMTISPGILVFPGADFWSKS